MRYEKAWHSPTVRYPGRAGAERSASQGGCAIGGGIPIAVGAQLAAPDRQVVVTTGDGSAMYTIQVLWTAAHYHLPLLIVVCNNASYDIVKLELLRMQGTLSRLDPSTADAFVGLGEPRLNFAQFASGMGIQGQVVHDRGELTPALQLALKTCAEGEPALVDVHDRALTIRAHDDLDRCREDDAELRRVAIESTAEVDGPPMQVRR